MISIEQIKKESAEKLERDIKLATEKNAILDAVTGHKILSALSIKSVCEHTYRADYTLNIIVHDDSEALKIFEDMDIAGYLLPVVKICNGWVAFGPENSVSQTEKESVDIENIGGWYAKISRCMPYKSQIEWVAYTMLAGFTVELKITVTSSEMDVEVEAERGPKGKIILCDGRPRYRWLGVTNWRAYFTDIISYSGTDCLKNYVVYNR